MVAVGLTFAIDFVQQYFVFIILPDSSSLATIFTTLIIQSLAVAKKSLWMSRSFRDWFRPKWPTFFPCNLLDIQPSDKKGDFQESLKFGLHTISSAAADISSILLLVTLYFFSPNKNLYTMAKIEKTRYYCVCVRCF